MAYKKKTTTEKKSVPRKTGKKVAPKKTGKKSSSSKKTAAKIKPVKAKEITSRKSRGTARRAPSTPKKATKRASKKLSPIPPEKRRIPNKRQLPDFHKEHPRVFEEDLSEFFVGRQIELEVLWNGMAAMADRKPRNYAWLAQRKIGKSALFKRFCNIAFAEQDTIVPLYYEIDNKLRPASEVADEMATTFIKQWMAFLTKDPTLMDIEDLTEAYQVSQKLKGYEEKFQNIFEAYYRRRERAELPSESLGSALDLVKSMVGRLKQKCILFLDEVQLLAIRIYADHDPKKEPVRCEGVIGALVQHPYIWFMVSGSRVSTLHYEVISGALANKLGKRGLQPLRERDAMDLVSKVVEAGGYEVYPDIEKDVYQLVGGNPYYIMTLFKKETQYTDIKDKTKSFRTPQELRGVFEFEVLDQQGEIFNFWWEHYAENEQLLNNNPPNRPGLSFEILKCIADRTVDKPENTSFHFQELAEVLDLSYEEFKERFIALEDADMVQGDRLLNRVYRIKDRVFAIVVRQLEHFKKSRSSSLSPEAQSIIDQRLGLVERHVENLKKDVDKAHKYLRKERGRVSNFLGERAELTIAEKIQAQKGWFKDMKVGELNNIKISLGDGKGYQIDIYGQVNLNGHSAKPSKPKSSGKTGRKPQKAALAVEVKERDKKVYISEARKFLEAIRALQRTKKARHVVAIYISKRGFSGSAEKLLKENGIYTGAQEDFGL